MIFCDGRWGLTLIFYHILSGNSIIYQTPSKVTIRRQNSLTIYHIDIVFNLKELKELFYLF